MRLRRIGPARIFGFVALAAATAFAVPACACDDGHCDTQFKGLASGQPQPPAADADAPAKMQKPLPLVSRTAGTPRLAAAPRTARRIIAARNSDNSTVKNAHAQAHDSDLGAQPHGTLTAADRLATPPTPMPIVPWNEVNEIDEAAPVETTTAGTRPAEFAPTAPRPAVAPRLSLAGVDPPATVTVARSDDSAWDKSSLIGKIFIAAGGLLTAASAIRMFIG